MIRGLDDALRAAVPHGTEVVTRVDRMVDGRRVPQGAVGRVVGIDGERYALMVVGVGRVLYLRDEILPRRAGQLAFAQRRESAWAALRPCVVLETTVGSRAWGLADEGSDVDRRGGFVLPFEWTAGIAEPPAELVSADGSETFWEVGKLVRQALRADPNMLEALFVDGARASDEIGGWILEARDAFPSQAIYGSFGRYALSQLAKLRASLRLAEHRTLLLGWLRDQPALSLDEVAERLARAAAVEAPRAEDAVMKAKEYVKQLYRSLFDQGLIAVNDFASLVGFARGDERAFELPRELRPKNAYNLVRLIATAIAWLRSGAPRFVVDEPLRSRLLAIKGGTVPLAEVLAEAEALTPALEEARASTPLPAHADLGRADALLRRIRGEVAHRWVGRAPGPWGSGAAAPPEVEWSA